MNFNRDTYESYISEYEHLIQEVYSHTPNSLLLEEEKNAFKVLIDSFETYVLSQKTDSKLFEVYLLALGHVCKNIRFITDELKLKKKGHSSHEIVRQFEEVEKLLVRPKIETLVEVIDLLYKIHNSRTPVLY